MERGVTLLGWVISMFKETDSPCLLGSIRTRLLINEYFLKERIFSLTPPHGALISVPYLDLRFISKKLSQTLQHFSSRRFQLPRVALPALKLISGTSMP